MAAAALISPAVADVRPPRNRDLSLDVTRAEGLLGTTLPTPLYPLYQERLGFGSMLTTVIFAPGSTSRWFLTLRRPPSACVAASLMW